MKFNLKQKSLLDASGELTAAARKALLEEVKQNPQANAEYETARENFAVFGAMAIPEPSADERKFIPAMIKHAIRGELLKQEKRAGRGRLLLRCAAGGVALAALVAIFSGMIISRHDQNMRMQSQAAQIHALIDRVTISNATPAMVRPIVITTPSENEENGMSSLAVVPEEPMSHDPSAPPGSF